MNNDHPPITDAMKEVLRRLRDGRQFPSEWYGWIQHHAIPQGLVHRHTKQLTPRGEDVAGKSHTIKPKLKLKTGTALLHLIDGGKDGYVTIVGVDGQIPLSSNEFDILKAVINLGGNRVTGTQMRRRVQQENPVAPKQPGMGKEPPSMDHLKIERAWPQLCRKVDKLLGTGAGKRYFIPPATDRNGKVTVYGYSTTVKLADAND